jgi:hypothetical protein
MLVQIKLNFMKFLCFAVNLSMHNHHFSFYLMVQFKALHYNVPYRLLFQKNKKKRNVFIHTRLNKINYFNL